MSGAWTRRDFLRLVGGGGRGGSSGPGAPLGLGMAHEFDSGSTLNKILQWRVEAHDELHIEGTGTLN